MDSFAVAGRQGNGNGMEYRGGIRVKSERSREELATYYPAVFEDESYLLVESDPEAEKLYTISLERYSIVGTEVSLWEALLNLDYRGH